MKTKSKCLTRFIIAMYAVVCGLTTAQANTYFLDVNGATEQTRDVDARSFPRLCAIAEIGWSSAEHRNFDDFENRLKPFLRQLETMGVIPNIQQAESTSK